MIRFANLEEETGAVCGAANLEDLVQQQCADPAAPEFGFDQHVFDLPLVTESSYHDESAKAIAGGIGDEILPGDLGDEHLAWDGVRIEECAVLTFTPMRSGIRLTLHGDHVRDVQHGGGADLHATHSITIEGECGYFFGGLNISASERRM